MKIYIFKSEANGGLYAFAGDEAGSNLPAGFAPWYPEGVIEAGISPPYNFSRSCFQRVRLIYRTWPMGLLATGALERETRDRRTGRGPQP